MAIVGQQTAGLKAMKSFAPTWQSLWASNTSRPYLPWPWVRRKRKQDRLEEQLHRASTSNACSPMDFQIFSHLPQEKQHVPGEGLAVAAAAECCCARWAIPITSTCPFSQLGQGCPNGTALGSPGNFPRTFWLPLSTEKLTAHLVLFTQHCWHVCSCRQDISSEVFVPTGNKEACCGWHCPYSEDAHTALKLLAGLKQHHGPTQTW